MVFPCFSVGNVLALSVLATTLGVGLASRPVGTDDIATRSERLDYPSDLDESFKIGLKLHANILWRPDHSYNKGFTPSDPASLTRTAQSTDATQADKTSDESTCPSSDLGDDHAPWHMNWKNSIALCAVMRHENITDVVEWLSYYKYVPRVSDQPRHSRNQIVHRGPVPFVMIWIGPIFNIFIYIYNNCFKICMYVCCRNLLVALFSRKVRGLERCTASGTLGPAAPMRRTK
jgi:hypothetical protein